MYIIHICKVFDYQIDINTKFLILLAPKLGKMEQPSSACYYDASQRLFDTRVTLTYKKI